jgi:hypothetical protein
MTAGQAALLLLVDRYRAGMLDACVSLLAIHKLLYFLQEVATSIRNISA